ncbi:adenylyl-sulfate kinase [bacterium]|nr:adenylyl-sulfate kinase [bacterium]
MERMNVVIVGHVDHGKSTFTGRLLADTGSLPDGKLDQVKAWCAVNARPFEYAFLLDALKDEQAQGVTIDAARCFFKSEKRHYIIIDAPGHIEFLKNMITGASRAEAAILLIDANEGVQENSRRHGYMLSMLGIKQVVVLINKMDLVNYDQGIFEKVKSEYSNFLSELGVQPAAWIPVCARDGDHLVHHSPSMGWYHGVTVLEAMDCFHKEQSSELLPFRFPVQDIYKFTAQQDDRRIVAGTIASGRISANTDVIFYPSGKRSRINTIEGFNIQTPHQVSADESTGFTLHPQIFIKAGEIMCKVQDPPPQMGTHFKANIFWLGKQPLVLKKNYKLKIGTLRVSVSVEKILNVINAAELNVESKGEVARHEVAEVILKTTKPIAFDTAADHPHTSRFVIVDEYDIAGGGIIMANHPNASSETVGIESSIELSPIDPARRTLLHGHSGKAVFISGIQAARIGKEIEQTLFESEVLSYFIGITDHQSIDIGLHSIRLLTNAGFVVIVAVDLSPTEIVDLAHVITDSVVISDTTPVSDIVASITTVIH